MTANTHTCPHCGSKTLNGQNSLCDTCVDNFAMAARTAGDLNFDYGSERAPRLTEGGHRAAQLFSLNTSSRRSPGLNGGE